MQFKAEVAKFDLKPTEDYKQVRFTIQSRVDNPNFKLDEVDLSAFDQPEEAVAKKIVYQNIPVMNEVCAVTLEGNGANNFHKLGKATPTEVAIRVKKIDEEHVAILSIQFAGLSATEELLSFLYLNLGGSVSVSFEKLQGELFDDGTDSTGEVVDIDNPPKGKSKKVA
jgi:hypothetical protein